MGKEKYGLWILFGGLFVVGLLAFGGYGMSWDEENMYHLGKEAYEFVTGSGFYTTHIGRRFHGPIVELFLYALQQAMGVTNTRNIFLLRHFATFMIFYAGAISFYRLCRRIDPDWRYAALGTLLLVLTPPIFAHAFFNSRDVPNLALFAISMFTLVRLLEKPTMSRALVHGVACAVAMSLRMTGLFLPIITFMMLGMEFLWGNLRGKFPSVLRIGLIYFLTFCIATYEFWPLLWAAPVTNFLAAYDNMAHIGRATFLFGTGRENPWWYIPFWIGVTTPTVYVLLFIVGIVATVRALRKPIDVLRKQPVLLMGILWFVLPIIVITLQGLEIYDEWRHMYFVYPGLLLLAVFGCRELMKIGKATRAVVVTVLAISCVSTAAWMVRYHPHQAAYYAIPGSFVEGQLEIDYWGLTYRKGFEYVLAHDPGESIPIHVTSPPGRSTLLILSKDNAERIALTDEASAKYILDNFRRDFYVKKYPAEKKIHSIMVGDIEALAIYKMY